MSQPFHPHRRRVPLRPGRDGLLLALVDDGGYLRECRFSRRELALGTLRDVTQRLNLSLVEPRGCPRRKRV